MFGRRKRQNSHYFHPSIGSANPYYQGAYQGGNYYMAGRQFNTTAHGPQLYPTSPYPVQPSFPPAQSYGHMQQEPIFEQPQPVDWLLQNPLEPKKHQGGGSQNPYWGNLQPYTHPYPKQNMVNRPPSGLNSFLNSFKAQDGSLDFNKMIHTAGQMVNTFSQVSGLVKGLGGFFKV